MPTKLETPIERKATTHIEIVQFAMTMKPNATVAVSYRPLDEDGKPSAQDVVLSMPTEVAQQWITQLGPQVELCVAKLIEHARVAGEEAKAAAAVGPQSPEFTVGLGDARAAADREPKATGDAGA